MSQSSAKDNNARTAAGQRKQVTVLFADMVSYMSLAEKLGEEDTYLFMQRIHRELAEAVHAHDGTVQEITGDGIMALFGAPIALEDAALKACRAALDIQTRITAIGDECEAEHGRRPAFRVGLHSGPLIIGGVGDDQKMQVTALGDTVNFASRLESTAENGTILISEAVQNQVADYVDLISKGAQNIKGRTKPQKLWQLTALKKGMRRFDVSQARGLSPLVGREAELEALNRAWTQTKAGKVQLVNVSAEAGLGKSRLLHEFRSVLGNEAFFLQGYCSTEGQAVPLHPFADVVRRSFGFALSANLQEARHRLHRGLEVLGLDPEQHLPYLLNLLGYDDGGEQRANTADENRGIRTRDAVLAMLSERCRMTPSILFIEDLHWMDSASEALISRILATEENLPLLVVTTHRPEYQHPWKTHAGTVDIKLSPLSSTATLDLLKAKLKVDELPENLSRMVTEKADGNPFFAEEITNYLLQSGGLILENGVVTLTSSDKNAVLPAGLENMLMDRFDRLAPEPRQVLEAAAILGQRFEKKLLAHMTDFGDSLPLHLNVLEEQDLIYPETGQTGYRFKHALAHDAVYNGMLSQQRKALHAAAGAAIEATKGFDAADALAHHYSRTDQHGKAIQFLALAGENSMRIYSLDEAADRLQSALALVETHSDAIEDTLLVDILLNICRIHYFRFEFSMIIDLVQKYLPRVEALGDQKRLSRFLFEGGYANVFACQVEPGRKLLARAKAIGEEIDDEVAVAYADLGNMWDNVFWGTPGEARDTSQIEASKRIIAVGQKHGDIWLASKGGVALALDHIAWGRPGDARDAAMQLMTLSRTSNDPRPRSMALWALAAIDSFSGNYKEAVENADEALRVCLSPIDIAGATSYKSIALIMDGQADAGFEIYDEIRDQIDDKGARILLFPVELAAGVGTVMQGNLGGGFKQIDKAKLQGIDWGQTQAQALGNMFSGLTYLQMATSDEKPPLSVLLKNLPFLLRTLPVVKKKARRKLQSALDQYQAMNVPSSTAQSMYSLALLDNHEKKQDAARAKFAEAREIAASVGAINIVTDCDAALATLA